MKKLLLAIILVTCTSKLWANEVPQTKDNYPTSKDSYVDITNIFDNFQQKEFQVLITSPSVMDIRPGQLVLVSTNGIVQIFTNINGQLVWFNSGLEGRAVYCSTSAQTMSQSVEISSINRTGTGFVQVTMAVPFADTNYTIVCGVDSKAGVSFMLGDSLDSGSFNKTTTTFRCHTGTSAGSEADVFRLHIYVWGKRG